MDQHNNRVSLIQCQSDTNLIQVVCEGEIEVADNSGVVGMHGGYAPLWHFKRATSMTQPGSELLRLCNEFNSSGTFADDVSLLHELSSFIRQNVSYQTGTTASNTTAEQAVKFRFRCLSGPCPYLHYHGPQPWISSPICKRLSNDE